MKHGDSASVPVVGVMWMYKCDVNSASGENWKKTSSSTEASFNEYKNEETLNGNKTCLSIAEHKRDKKYIQILLAPTKNATENIEEGFYD